MENNKTNHLNAQEGADAEIVSECAMSGQDI